MPVKPRSSSTAVLIRHPASLASAAFAAKLDDARAADRIAAAGPRPIRIIAVPRAALHALVARAQREADATVRDRSAAYAG